MALKVVGHRDSRESGGWRGWSPRREAGTIRYASQRIEPLRKRKGGRREKSPREIRDQLAECPSPSIGQRRNTAGALGGQVGGEEKENRSTPRRRVVRFVSCLGSSTSTRRSLHFAPSILQSLTCNPAPGAAILSRED